MRPLFVMAALWAMGAVPAFAQDPVKVDPKHYKVEFENEQVRVLRISYGQKFTTPDGKSTEVSVKAA